MQNCYLETFNRNLLSEYFEVLSSSKQKPQLSKELLGATPICQSRNVLFLLSFLLLKVYEYSYEDAFCIFSDLTLFRKFLYQHNLSGAMDCIVIYGSKGYISIGRNRFLILEIIYRNLDIETDLKTIYEIAGRQRHKSEIRFEYKQVCELLERQNLSFD